MNIIHVALIIILVPDGVFPKPPLPDAPFSLLPAANLAVLSLVQFRAFHLPLLLIKKVKLTYAIYR
jgi:hypothetical protein